MFLYKRGSYFLVYLNVNTTLGYDEGRLPQFNSEFIC